MGDEHKCAKAEVLEIMQKQIQTLDEQQRDLIRFTAIIEQQVETNREQTQSLCKLSETMVSISEVMKEQKEALKNINDKLDLHENKLSQIDIKFERQALENLQRYSFNIMEFIQKVVPYLVGVGVLYGILNIKDLSKLITGG